MNQAHHEKHFEHYIVERLVAQGWLLGESKHYDTDRALYPEDVIGWIQSSCPKQWTKLNSLNKDRTETVLLDRLAGALDKHGTVQVLRRGFSIAGCGHLDMSEGAPEDARNQEVIQRYRSNRLRVVPQLYYHPARKFSIDLVFFINGIAVATVEVKTEFTQSVEDAMQQYRLDRLPVDKLTRRKEPLLTFKRGAVVHFAMSDTDICMATKLDGENTYFLPFNKGCEGRAGNPARTDGEYPVAYFWEELCQPDAWLRIFHSFVYVEKKQVVDLKGNWECKETLIFPRYHQWSAVNSMIADAKSNGPGMSYLCEHSAGSGKTSTIAWTAHDLVSMRQPTGEAVFDSVIIVTDRNVLDSQLQDAVQQIDHQIGMIAAIGKEKGSASKSSQLTKALLEGVDIIVVTIQTFPHAMEAILTEKTLGDKSFAVVIDEAHTSQTGSTASKLQATLSLSSKQGIADMTVEELLEHIQQSRVRPSNISHFAFTATPKHSTLMLFGRPKDPSKPASDDNLPQSFHKYPMRQAIDEGFILDVLQKYTPYKAAFNLGEQLKDDKRVDKKSARRALAQWMALHPTNVTQKVEFIVEHFHKNVAHLLEHKAKAMIVTSSRAAAVRYKKALDAYLLKHPARSDIKALVAFSGKLTGLQVNHPEDERLRGDDFIVDDDAEFTEINMNPGIESADLKATFDRPEYRIMLVANKFQTGFDQPKLVAMYIDKKIANEVEIVQTFSRLNRTFPGKDQTFVIDFINDPAVVKKAFAVYDSGAQITEIQDPNIVYEIRDQLDEARIYDEKDLENFRKVRHKIIRLLKADSRAHKELTFAMQRPTDIFNHKLHTLQDAIATWEATWQTANQQGDQDRMKSADHKRSELTIEREKLMDFKGQLARFGRSYAYVAQLIDFGDPELENYAAFARLLFKKLAGVTPENVDMKGLMLTGYDIQSAEDAASVDEDLVLHPIGAGGSEGQDRERQYLSEIISRLNSLFGSVTPLSDQANFVNQVASIAKESEVVMAQVENNTREQTMHGDLPTTVEQAVVRALGSHEKLATLLLKSDKQSMGILNNLIYDLLKRGESVDFGKFDQ